MAAQTPDWAPIAYLAHQSAEKLLKALIVGFQRRPLYLHELEKLLVQCPIGLQEDTGVRDAVELLDRIYPRMRYPTGAPISGGEGQAVVAAMKLIHDIARPLVRLP